MGKLTDAAYPLMKEVKWDSYVYNLKPGGSATAGDWAKAVDKAIEMGAAMDPKLLKAGVQAHHKAIGSLTGNNLVLSKADFESINAAIGRMIASVPESKTMAVYDAFSALVCADVPAYLMSTVNEADAKKAYGALMDFKDAVKANPITATAPETPAALSGKLGAIDGAEFSAECSRRLWSCSSNRVGFHCILEVHQSAVGLLRVGLVHCRHQVRRNIRADERGEGVVDRHRLALGHGGDHAADGSIDGLEIRLRQDQVVSGKRSDGLMVGLHASLEQLWVHRRAHLDGLVHCLRPVTSSGAAPRFEVVHVRVPLDLLHQRVRGVRQLLRRISDRVGHRGRRTHERSYCWQRAIPC